MNANDFDKHEWLAEVQKSYEHLIKIKFADYLGGYPE